MKELAQTEEKNTAERAKMKANHWCCNTQAGVNSMGGLNSYSVDN